MDGTELFSHCVRQATVVVKQVRPEHLANSTPCNDWHARDLLDHMLAELQLVPAMLAGEKALPEDTEADEDDLVTQQDVDIFVQWQAAADAAEAASGEADADELAHPSYGDVTNDVYMRQIGTDLLVHAWDLAAAIGMPVTFAAGPVQAAYTHALSSQNVLQPSDSYAAPVEVSEKASVQTKLLALYGRSLNWRRTAA